MSDNNGLIVCKTPEEISAFRLLAIKGRLKLELAGMKARGPSTFSIVKKEFGFKGKNASILAQFENMLREKGILPKAVPTDALKQG